MARAPGQTVGPFVIDRLLNEGGMGEVYLAHDPRWPTPVLLKLPLPELLGDVGAYARFEREANALRRLRHPGVQRFLAAGQQGLTPYLGVEFVEGESVRDALRRRGRFPPEEAVRLAIALADALAYCHAQGVVHRDVKPENVILASPDGHPVLIDFGSVLLEGAKRLTFSGLTGELGTPEYMAPEQIRGQRGDARTDVYALGALLYELLAGRPPYPSGPGESAVRVMRRQLEDPLLPPGAPGADPALEGVLARALRRDPEGRFQTAAAFRDALADPAGAVARGEVTPGWPRPAAGPAALAWGTPLDEPQSLRDWLRYVLAALAVILVIVAIGFLAAWLRPVPH
jgi:serine/threonine-protein kinase